MLEPEADVCPKMNLFVKEHEIQQDILVKLTSKLTIDSKIKT